MHHALYLRLGKVDRAQRVVTDSAERIVLVRSYCKAVKCRGNTDDLLEAVQEEALGEASVLGEAQGAQVGEVPA